MAPVIEASGLRRVFTDPFGRPRVVAVEGLDLRLEPGEVVGLLGPNGSGKSTTIRMLLGLLRPTAGQVSLFGLPPVRPEAKRRVGYQAEESPLYPHLSGPETLHYLGALSGLDPPTRQQRVGDLLAMVGLAEAGARRVATYSKGMARRLALAQALLHDPDLLVLDEPAAGLDPVGAHELKEWIRTLAGQGKAVLLCSHHLAEVESVCDRVLLLQRGRVLAQGGLRELLRGETLEQYFVRAVQAEPRALAPFLRGADDA